MRAIANYHIVESKTSIKSHRFAFNIIVFWTVKYGRLRCGKRISIITRKHMVVVAILSKGNFKQTTNVWYSKTIKLIAEIVSDTPRILSAGPDRLTTAPLFTPAAFECVAEGNPPPIFKWFQKYVFYYLGNDVLSIWTYEASWMLKHSIVSISIHSFILLYSFQNQFGGCLSRTWSWSSFGHR